ncbi:murein biosynthesis integral membrane protein MurJ [Fibrobacterota bacterium]
MKKPDVMRGTLIIAASLVLSRFLGVFREILLAGLAGLNADKNAYDLAFLLPDIINHLISTGYLSVTFIPVFTGYLVQGKEHKSWDFFSNILTTCFLLLIGATIIVWVFSEPLILALSRSDPNPETLKLAVRYCRIILPAQLCFFAGAILTAVQHVNLRFLVPALSGLVYNFSIILGGWLGRTRGLEGFAWGVLLGAFLGSFLLQIWGGKQAGARYKLKINVFDPDFIRFVKLTLPLILGLGAVFALELVFRVYGSNFGQAGIAKLGYAYRMMYTIVAVFGFSVGVASYPLLARLAKEGKLLQINDILFSTILKILAIMSPVVLILWFCAEPVIRILFQRGEFSPAATVSVAQLLKWYLWSSFALSAQIILLRCYYALEKMWLPTLINTGIFFLTLPLYELFSAKFGIRGIPMAGFIGTGLQVMVLLLVWAKLAGIRGKGGAGVEALKIMAALLIMLLSISFFHDAIFKLQPDSSWPLAVFLLVFCISVFSLQISLQWLFRVSATRSIVRDFSLKMGLGTKARKV